MWQEGKTRRSFPLCRRINYPYKGGEAMKTQWNSYGKKYRWNKGLKRKKEASPQEALFFFRLYVCLLIFAVCGGICLLPADGARQMREDLKAALVKNISLEEAQHFLTAQKGKLKTVFSQTEEQEDVFSNGEVPFLEETEVEPFEDGQS